MAQKLSLFVGHFLGWADQHLELVCGNDDKLDDVGLPTF